MQGRVHDGVVSYERRRGDGGRGESRHENSESVRSHLCAVVCMEGGVGAITHTSGVLSSSFFQLSSPDCRETAALNRSKDEALKPVADARCARGRPRGALAR